MTEQEAYDRIRAWFVDESHVFPAAVLEPGEVEAHCVYYDAETGARCAAGCLFTQEQYDTWNLEANEGTTVGSLCSKPEVAGYLGDAIHFLSRAQTLHDSFAPGEANINADGTREQFIRSIDRLAADYGLEVA